MGSNTSKIQLAVLYSKQIVRPLQFIQQFCHDKNIVIHEYTDFNQFIEKQSLKKISNILILQSAKRQENIQNDQNNDLMHPAFLDLNKYIGHKGKHAPSSIRKSLIEYIKKYSLQYLNLYIWSNDVISVDVAASQMCYITLISNNLKRVKQHIIKKQRQKIINAKFKRLVKDLYRKVQVAVIYSDSKQSQTEKKDLAFTKLKKIFMQSHISIQKFDSIKQFSQKTTSLHAEFIICFQQQNLLQLVEFTKNLAIDSKIIYFGTRQQINSNQKKVLGTWLTLDDLASLDQNKNQINQGMQDYQKNCQKLLIVIKNCSHISPQKKQKYPCQVIIYFQQLYQIAKLQETKHQILKILKDKQQQISNVNREQIKFLTGNACQLFQTIQKEIYTILILFDSTPRKLQFFKSKLRKNNFSQRVQITMLQLKNRQKLENQVARKELIKCLTEKQLKSNFTLKFQIGPIETINLLNPQKNEKLYFENKLGLKANQISTSIVAKQNNLNQYRGFGKKKQSLKSFKIFEDFHLITKVKDYQQNLHAFLQQKQKSGDQEYIAKIKIIIYDKKENIILFFARNGYRLSKKHMDNKLQKIYLQGDSKLKLAKNVIMVHYLFQRIQEYLIYAQVPKISLAFFGKGALRQLYEINNKTLAVVNSRSFALNATFVSNNQLLKTVFQQNKVKISSQFQMLLVKFPVLNRMSQFQIDSFQQYIRRYAKLWNIGYNILAQTQIIELGKQQRKLLTNLFVLKEDIKKSFYKCRTYELLKVTDQQFKYFYIDRIDMCSTLLDLQITCIYIYSLPHGVSQIVNSIFREPLQTSLSIKIFCHFLLVLFLNFYSVQNQQMQKLQLVIYLQDQRIKQVYQNIKEGDIIYNRNFLHCCKNQSINQNNRNHCMIIQLQNVPFLCRSSIKSVIQIQRFSFYKQSAQYLMAPFTKFKLKNKFMKGDHYNLVFETPINYSNLFISQIFQNNKLQFLNYCQILENEINNNKQKLNDLIRPYDSIYKKAETMALLQEKKQLENAIKNGATYRMFLSSIQKSLYSTATKQLTSIIRMSQRNKQKHTEQMINSQSIQQNLNSNLLKIQKAMLEFKTVQYNKSLQLLTQVLDFLKEQKIQGQDMWIQKQLQNLKVSVQQTFKYRKIALDGVKKVNCWEIDMNGQTESNSQVPKICKKKIKWSVNFQQNQQLFVISPCQDIQIINFKKGAKIKIAEPQNQFGRLQCRQDENIEQYNDITEDINFALKHHIKQSEQRSNMKNSDKKKFKQTGQILLDMLLSQRDILKSCPHTSVERQKFLQKFKNYLATKQTNLQRMSTIQKGASSPVRQIQAKAIQKAKKMMKNKSQKKIKEDLNSEQSKTLKIQNNSVNEKDKGYDMKDKKGLDQKQRQTEKIDLNSTKNQGQIKQTSHFGVQAKDSLKILLKSDQKINDEKKQISEPNMQIQQSCQTLVERSLKLKEKQKVQWQMFQFQGKMKLVLKHKKFKVPLQKGSSKLWKNQSKIK